jgi:putative ABC transport system substrate-binding protein
MKRRLLLLGMLAAPAAWAQPVSGKLRRVGVLAPSTAEKEAVTLKPFFDRMAELGWVEGRTVAYDRAYADDQHGRLASLAEALVVRAPEVIFAPPATAAVAASRATRSIPIAFGSVTDPVSAGLVSSLARPTGNVTGISNYGDSLAPKRLEILLELVRKVRRIGLIADPSDPTTRADQAALAPVLAASGLSLAVALVAGPQDVEQSLESLASKRIDALLTTTSLTFNLREQVMAFAARQRWPVVGHRPPMADAGALAAYASSLAEQLRRSADVIDKLLKGRKPSEIPIEQPTMFDMVINLKAARTLGIKVPQSVMLRATRVIE